jgi:hypothetical protein
VTKGPWWEITPLIARRSIPDWFEEWAEENLEDEEDGEDE